MSEPRCTCKPGRIVAVDCPKHGKALRKRSPDDWSAIMGATLPNQAEITEKGGTTHVQ